jgi:hypothetical protein
MRARAAAILAFAVLALAAQAQYGGGQRKPRTDRPADSSSSRDAQAARHVQAPDPILAIEHELPSLAIDLLVTAEQRPLWVAFERAVRDVADLSRQHTRKLLSPYSLDAPTPNASATVNGLADDDRMRADAMADVVARLKALQDVLAPTQRSLLDRRILQAITEPLGTQ